MAMQAELRVEPDVLISKSSEMANIRSQTSSIMEEIKSQMASLTGAWEGEAASAFQAQFNKTHADIESMLKIVDEYSADLSDIGQTYKTAEAKVSEASSALPGNVFGA